MSKKMTTEQFIERARKVHGDKYDYSKVNYVNSRTDVCIVCPQHGEFFRKPFKILSSVACPQCSKGRKAQGLRTPFSVFLEKAQKLFGSKYLYIESSYIGMSKPMRMVCPKHGEFYQIPASHLRGHGCRKCALEGTLKYTKEECLEKARLCDSRVEFESKYNKYMTAAKRHGWYEECCAHMPKPGNKKRCIYSYEFTKYNAVYVGLTFSINVRDRRHHKEGAVYDFAKQMGCDIPQPKQLTDYMPQEEASIAEGVCLQGYIDRGWSILNRIKTGSLGGQETLNYEIDVIEKSMEGYDSLTTWEKDFSSYHLYIVTRGHEDIIDKHFPNRMQRIYNDYEECKSAYSQCVNVREVKERFPGALAAAKRHGWHEELKKLCPGKPQKWTREACAKMVRTYKTLYDLRKYGGSAYQMIMKRQWYDLLEPLKRLEHEDYHFTLEEICDICSNYKNRVELKASRPEVVYYCDHHKIDLYEMNGWQRANMCSVQLIQNDVVVAEFETQKQAAEYVGTTHKHLSRYLDKDVVYCGYIWKRKRQ